MTVTTGEKAPHTLTIERTIAAPPFFNNGFAPRPGKCRKPISTCAPVAA